MKMACGQEHGQRESRRCGLLFLGDWFGYRLHTDPAGSTNRLLPHSRHRSNSPVQSVFQTIIPAGLITASGEYRRITQTSLLPRQVNPTRSEGRQQTHISERGTVVAKAWGGRFQQATDPRVEAFTESISFDWRLYEVDIRGSIAHATMLASVGLITTEERDSIAENLQQIGQEIAAGEFPFKQELEDIHMHIESALIARIGDVGRKLHTGRSRNDQVSTDIKLYVRDAIDQLDALLKAIQQAFVDRCDRDIDLVLPGYTHLQRAQPVLAPHYWLAWTEKFQRDRERLADCRKRTNVSPLGAAALAGTSLPIDRNMTAELLGFDSVAANSLDVSSDRDYLAEFVFAMSLIATHLSSWAEEWILWFSTEFGFLKLPDAYTTGSSIMPQKRNPDVLELIRGRTARIVATVPQILVLLKSLPMAYNRDLQEDKLGMFAALDALSPCLELAPAIVTGAELQRHVINARLEDGFLDATALMEYLIKRGVPMRTGHETVGKLVAECEGRGCRLAELPLQDLQQACDLIDADVAEVLGTINANAALQSYGSGGREPVLQQIAAWKARLQE
jgi:argininosuccinate lyase